LDHEFEGRDDLLIQMASLTVKQVDVWGGLALRANDQSFAKVLSRTPVEASCSDSDGVPIFAMLHVVKGKMVALDIFKADGSNIVRPITAEEMKVY